VGEDAAGGRPAPLIDQVHKLMHLWKGGDVNKVNEYLDSRGLRRSPIFAQLLQALIELAPQGDEQPLEALGEVGDGIEQGAVEVEGDGFEAHQTFSSSPRRAAMMES